MPTQTYIRQLEKLETIPHPDGPHPGITRIESTDYFTNLGIQAPSEYLEWLEVSNGAYVDSQFLTGIATGDHLDMEMIYARFPNWVNAGFIPVAGDGLGNFYAIETREKYGSGQPIVFFDHEESMETPSFIVASRFPIFLAEFIDKETNHDSPWPYSKEAVLQIDPEIEQFHGIAKAFEA